jgi:hypothetical protein
MPKWNSHEAQAALPKPSEQPRCGRFAPEISRAESIAASQDQVPRREGNGAKRFRAVRIKTLEHSLAFETEEVCDCSLNHSVSELPIGQADTRARTTRIAREIRRELAVREGFSANPHFVVIQEFRRNYARVRVSNPAAI